MNESGLAATPKNCRRSSPQEGLNAKTLRRKGAKKKTPVRCFAPLRVGDFAFYSRLPVMPKLHRLVGLRRVPR